MSLKPTQDPSLIVPLLVEAWEGIAEDGQTPDQIAVVDGYTYLSDGGNVLFIIVPKGIAYCEIHIICNKEYRGQYALNMSRLAVQYIWDNTLYQTITCEIPAYNKASISMASMAGFHKTGEIPFAYLHNGRLWNIHMMCRTRED